MASIIVNFATTEKRYCLIDNKKMIKLFVEQPSQQSLVGNIYLGIVAKVLPGMNAVFVDIGEEKKGFLQLDKLASFVQTPQKNKSISAFVHQGERILVQVEKDAAGSKGPRLTGLVEFTGENLIYIPHGGFVATSQKIEDAKLRDELKLFGEGLITQPEGIIFRTNSAKFGRSELTVEFNELREQYEMLQKELLVSKGPKLLMKRDPFLAQLTDELNMISKGEIWVDDLSFKQRLEKILDKKRKKEHISIHFYQEKENIFSSMAMGSEVEKALKRMVWLDSGACIVIDETEALTIFDVNTGKYVGKSNREMTVQQVNLEAAVEIARQIILRDLGGMILIDFIDMKFDHERKSVMKVLSEEIKKDAKKPKMIGFTELGILQLTRRKTKPTLSETLQMKCPTCAGTGRVLTAESVSFQLERELWEYRQSEYEVVYIDISEDIYRLYSGNQLIHLQRLEEMIGMKIHFTCVEKCKPFYEIKKFGSL